MTSASYDRTTPANMIDLRYVKKLIEILDESTVDSIEISSDKGMKIRISKSPTQRGAIAMQAPMAMPAMMPAQAALPAQPAAPAPQKRRHESVKDRSPEEFEGIGQPHQGKEADGSQIDPLVGHPRLEHGGGQEQGHAAGKPHHKGDQHAGREELAGQVSVHVDLVGKGKFKSSLLP